MVVKGNFKFRWWMYFFFCDIDNVRNVIDYYVNNVILYIEYDDNSKFIVGCFVDFKFDV